MIQDIFCDESGFTGNNLLHVDQPFFVYASIAISHDEAAACVDEIIKNHGVQGGELKGSKLLRYNKGRKAISTILHRFNSQIKVVAHNKKYALACKFFEYIFEPTISSINSMFYGVNFHRFIANLLYMHFVAQAKYAEEIFSDFEQFMRGHDSSVANYLFKPVKGSEVTDVLGTIQHFAALQRSSILDEIDSLRGTGPGKWVLELTDSSLHSLLSCWGEKADQMRVFCDNSKALKDCLDIFEAMVGRSDKKYIQFQGKKRLITYNLKESIAFVDSKTHPGVQLADVAAAAFGYILQNQDDESSKEWSQYIPNCLHEDSTFPEYEYIDLDRLEVKRNFLMLQELYQRSVESVSLTDNWDDFMRVATYELMRNPSLLST